MKSFNRLSSHGQNGSKRLELTQHAHSCGPSHAFTHTPTSTQLQPRCAKRQLSYYRMWNQTLFEGTWGRGSKPEYLEKTDSLPANQYYIFWGENPTSWMEIEPSPSNIGDRISWARARGASDPLSYRLLPLQLSPSIQDYWITQVKLLQCGLHFTHNTKCPYSAMREGTRRTSLTNILKVCQQPERKRERERKR